MAYTIDRKAYAKALGTTLRTLRRVRGHKRIVVSLATGFSENSISNWESGKHMPDLHRLLTLTEFYKTSMSTVITNAEKVMYMLEKRTTGSDE